MDADGRQARSNCLIERFGGDPELLEVVRDYREALGDS